MDNRTKLPESTLWLLAISAVYFTANLITGQNYPVFRDEFYYIDCAKHLSYGYVDEPPFSILVLSVWKAVFGISQLSLRVIPALLGSLLIFITGLLTREMGGNKTAQVISAVSVLCAPVYLALGGFYSMNAFDLVFWVLLFYLLVKIINTGERKLWLWFGVVAGLGLMNKISVGYFGAGILAAILFTKERKWFGDKYFWLGGGIALLIFMPYVVWNYQNDFATIEFIRNASAYKNLAQSPLSFLKEQVLQMNPLNLVIWLSGLAALLVSKELKKYRLFAISFIVIFLILSLSSGKPYYLASAFPVLISAGSIAVTGFFERKRIKYLNYAYGALLLISIAVFSPLVLPILSPDDLPEYMTRIGIKPSSGENLALGRLPQLFADRFGWEEMAKDFAGIYNSLSEEEKKMTVISVENYGEAGALNYFSEKYELPRVFCNHNNHWLWGNSENFENIETVIILGGSAEDHLELFEEVTPAGRTLVNPYVMPYEYNSPLFIARHPKVSLRESWKKAKKYI